MKMVIVSATIGGEHAGHIEMMCKENISFHTLLGFIERVKEEAYETEDDWDVYMWSGKPEVYEAYKDWDKDIFFHEDALHLFSDFTSGAVMTNSKGDIVSIGKYDSYISMWL